MLANKKIAKKLRKVEVFMVKDTTSKRWVTELIQPRIFVVNEIKRWSKIRL